MRQRIGDFLLRRLQEAGIKHLFGVPGDYNLEFMQQLEDRGEELSRPLQVRDIELDLQHLALVLTCHRDMSHGRQLRTGGRTLRLSRWIFVDD